MIKSKSFPKTGRQTSALLNQQIRLLLSAGELQGWLVCSLGLVWSQSKFGSRFGLGPGLGPGLALDAGLGLGLGSLGLGLGLGVGAGLVLVLVYV